MRAWAFSSELGHGRALEVGGEWEVLAVERVDLGADGLVLLGDDPVGDAGVGEGHLHGAVPEQGGDGFESHAAVDGLGGQGVAQLVRVDVDAGGASDPADDADDLVSTQGAPGVGDEAPVAADVVEVVDGPCGEELDELGVEGHVAVVAELADGNAEPVTVPNEHHRVGVEVA